MGPLIELRDWLSGRGLEVVLIVLGSVLLARFVAWVGSRITDRIDSQSTGGDVLVRSEAAKHRHSLTQVLTWAAIVLIWSITIFFVLETLGVPVTGSGTTRASSSNTSASRRSVSTSSGDPAATSTPSRMATRRCA